VVETLIFFLIFLLLLRERERERERDENRDIEKKREMGALHSHTHSLRRSWHCNMARHSPRLQRSILSIHKTTILFSFTFFTNQTIIFIFNK